MFGFIAFGGVVFWLIVAAFVVYEGFLIYNDKNKVSLFSLVICIAAMFLLVDDWPSFNWKLLAIYPALAVLWLPVYWYLELKKEAAAVKAAIIREGTPRNWGDMSRDLRNHRFIEFDNEGAKDSAYRVNIKHPHVTNLTANAVFWPVSVPVFFSDSFIRYMVDTLTEWMEEWRKQINESVMVSLGLNKEDGSGK